MDEEDSQTFSFFFLDQVPSLRRWLQLVYFSCIIIALGGMIYQCTTLFTDMRNEPITTYIDTHNPVRRFPTVSICPTHFKYNYKKLREASRRNKSKSGIHYMDNSAGSTIDSRFLQYLTSLESLSYVKAWMAHVHYTEEQWRLYKDHLWNTVIGENGTYEETELYLTHDFDDVVQEVPGSPIINKRKFMSVLGACYAFDFNTSIPLMAGRLAQTEFALRRRIENTKVDYRADHSYFYDNSDRISLGEPSFWSQNPEMVIYQTKKEVKDTTNDPSVYEFRAYVGYNVMKTLTDYRIKFYVTSVTFNRLNLRRRPCRDWSEQDRSICMVQCFNDEFCSKMTDPCLMYHPNQTREEQHRNLCSWMEGEIYVFAGTTKHCLTRPEVWNGGMYDSLCTQRCPIMLRDNQLHYERSHLEESSRSRGLHFCNVSSDFSSDDDTDDMMNQTTFWANVTLRLHDSQRQLKLYEHLVWSTDTLAAALASAGSLWTGLSGLAVMGIISSVCIQFRKRKRAEKTVA